MNILLIEYEKEVINLLKKRLELDGYKLDVACDGIEGLDRVKKKNYDLFILDWMLPEIDGIEVCKKLREDRSEPLLMLTTKDGVVKDDTEEKIKGLDNGADDCLTRPFEYEELLARVRSISRRGKRLLSPNTKLTIADLELDTKTHLVKRGKKIISLTPKEYGILEYSLRNPGRVIDGKELFYHVWGRKTGLPLNVVGMHISNLRKKIDRNFKTKLIHTMPKKGYRLDLL